MDSTFTRTPSSTPASTENAANSSLSSNSTVNKQQPAFTSPTGQGIIIKNPSALKANLNQPQSKSSASSAGSARNTAENGTSARNTANISGNDGGGNDDVDTESTNGFEVKKHRPKKASTSSTATTGGASSSTTNTTNAASSSDNKSRNTKSSSAAPAADNKKSDTKQRSDSRAKGRQRLCRKAADVASSGEEEDEGTDTEEEQQEADDNATAQKKTAPNRKSPIKISSGAAKEKSASPQQSSSARGGGRKTAGKSTAARKISSGGPAAAAAASPSRSTKSGAAASKSAAASKKRGGQPATATAVDKDDDESEQQPTASATSADVDDDKNKKSAESSKKSTTAAAENDDAEISAENTTKSTASTKKSTAACGSGRGSRSATSNNNKKTTNDATASSRKTMTTKKRTREPTVTTDDDDGADGGGKKGGGGKENDASSSSAARKSSSSTNTTKRGSSSGAAIRSAASSGKKAKSSSSTTPNKANDEEPPIASLSGNLHHNLRGSSFVAEHHQNSQRHVLPNSRLSHLFHEAMQLRDDYVTGYLKNVSIVFSSALHPRYVRDLAAHPQYGLHGIENLSNTCCLSVIVQALVKTPVFREYMLARMHHCQPHPAAAASTTSLDCVADFATRDVYKCLTCALSKATIDMFALPVGDVFDPCSIMCSAKRILAARNWQWSSAEQHDPAEILDKVLETIEREAELAGETSRISPLLSGRRAVVMRDDHHMHQVMFGAEKGPTHGGDMQSANQCGGFTKRLKVSAPQEHSVMFTSMRTRHPSTVSTASSGNNSGKSVEIISSGCIAAATTLSSTLTARTPSSSSANVSTSCRTLRSATAGGSTSARTVTSASTATVTDANQRTNINSASSVPVLTDNFVDVIFRGLILLIRRCPDCNEGDSVTVDKFTILYLSIDGSKVDNEHATSSARQHAGAADGVTSPTTSMASSSSTTVSGVSANEATNGSTETTGSTTPASANASSGANTTVTNGDKEKEGEEAPSSSSNTATSPNIIEPTAHNNITLEQCIDGFVCEHVLDNVMCNICLKKQKIQKTRFALLPPILIFTLKRYSTKSRKKASSKQHATDATQSSAASANAKNAEKPKKLAKKPTKSSSTVKLESDADSPAVVSVAPATTTSNPGTFHKSQVIVAYPLELDMSPYCADRYIMNDFATAAATTNSHANSSHHHESAEDVNFVYELYGVVQHLGQELDKGHYVCWVKHISGKWFYFDDRNVLHSNLEYVLTREAYMLFYRRKRLVSGVEQLVNEIRLGTAAAKAAANDAAAAQRHDRFKQTTVLLETLAKDVMEIGEDVDAAASGSSVKGITAASEVAAKVAGETDG